VNGNFFNGWDSSKTAIRADKRKAIEAKQGCGYPGCSGGFIITNESLGSRASISSLARCPKCNGERK
jgi:hypothetical protein